MTKLVITIIDDVVVAELNGNVYGRVGDSVLSKCVDGDDGLRLVNIIGMVENELRKSQDNSKQPANQER